MSSPDPRADLFLAKLDALPARPGCYLFKDRAGAVVYVGKAKSIRSRVRSYFQESTGDNRYFVPILRGIVGDLETVVTSSEKEAAVLENNLIKQHQPRFNVKLRDDKEFLCLRLDPQAPWPRLAAVRRPAPDGARYFGPYHSATAARRTLHLVNKHFQLRTCSDAELRSRRRPCLQYQIRRCPGPCVMEVDRAWYADQVRAVAMFLDGRHDELTRELEERMQQASGALEFETAALYRDQLRAIESVRASQRVVSVRNVDQDVIGLYREGPLVELVLIVVRGGRVNETLSFSMRGVEVPDEEVVSAFLAQHYGEDGGAPIPDEVLVPVLPDGVDGVVEWLGDRRGRRVLVLVPQRGPRAGLLRLAAENAAHAFREKQRASDDLEERLAELRDKLRLPTLPRRIECCDISHLGGGDTVGAIVALRDGRPDKKRYRSFHVRGAGDGDDYGAMYEVLARRFRRGRAARREARPPSPEGGTDAGAELPLVRPEEAERVAPGDASAGSGVAEDAEWELPDLLVVDGGRGQLQVALTAANDLGLHDLPVVALAKERESAAGEKIVERVYLPGQKNGIPLRATSSSLFLLARARDEAHRFANHARKRLGRARRLRTELDAIPGLGPTVRRALLTRLGSVAAIRAASDEEILAAPGVTVRHLSALRKVIPNPAG